MESPLLVPIIVAIFGMAQFTIALLTGRKTSQALATKDEATAVKEIAASYQMLVKSLETRLSYLQKSYHLLGQENKSQALVIINQQAEIRHLKPTSHEEQTP